MAKLTKAQAKAHNEAVALLQKDELTFDEKWFVMENWREDASHVNSLAGAFFTPIGLANDFCIEVDSYKTLDLCAGIGMLSFMHNRRGGWDRVPFELTCVELNPDYVEVGKKVLPEANWINADVFELPPPDIFGKFDIVISNPPFGATPSRLKRRGPNYTGSRFEYHVIDIGLQYADYGVFIIPQGSSPFKLSGVREFSDNPTDEYKRFEDETGIFLRPSCGIDTSLYQGDWHGVSPAVEIVVAERI